MCIIYIISGSIFLRFKNVCGYIANIIIKERYKTQDNKHSFAFSLAEAYALD